jgi:hypothetical protein
MSKLIKIALLRIKFEIKEGIKSAGYIVNNK